MILSALRIVLSRCAMTSAVRPFSTSSKLHPPLADLGIIAPRQLLDELVTSSF
jgi:hypothetical protein